MRKLLCEILVLLRTIHKADVEIHSMLCLIWDELRVANGETVPR